MLAASCRSAQKLRVYLLAEWQGWTKRCRQVRTEGRALRAVCALRIVCVVQKHFCRICHEPGKMSLQCIAEVERLVAGGLVQLSAALSLQTVAFVDPGSHGILLLLVASVYEGKAVRLQ